jgi:hypothetical protein
MVFMIEAQIEHVLAAVKAMARRHARTVEVSREAYGAYNREIDGRMGATVWESGCSSFYIDATGRNGVLWPDWSWRFRRRAVNFDPAAYEFASAQVREAVA